MPRPRPMISYAQNREDVLLDRALADVETGFYVDVGANDPDQCSVTRHFYAHGWRGINIEPGAIFDKLQRARPRDINLNLAVSDTSGTMTFREFPEAHPVSTLEAAPDVPEFFLKGAVTRPVPVRTLRDIFGEFQPPTIDFLSVDVEGHERQVLLGNDWSRFRPRIVVVEATEPTRPTPVHHRWEHILLSADYLFAFFDGVNRFYVRREDERLCPLLAVPANVFDAYLIDLNDASYRDMLASLQTRERHYHDTVMRLTAEITEIHRDTGGRTLQIGLWFARQLHRLGKLGRLLKGPRQDAA